MGTQNGTEIKIKEINGEVMITEGELSMIKIHLKLNEDDDVIYAVVERFRNWITVIGAGISFDDALLSAKWRADMAEDPVTMQRVEALERAYYGRIYERGRSDE